MRKSPSVNSDKRRTASRHRRRTGASRSHCVALCLPAA